MTEPTWEVLPPEDPTESRPQADAAIRRSHLRMAFTIAIASDLGSVFFEFAPPLEWLLDLATAGALYLVLGRQPLILPALLAEAVPGVAAFPTWVLVVGSIALWGTVAPMRPAGPR